MKEKCISIRMIVLITFILVLLSTVGVICAVVLSNGLSMSDETASRKAASISSNVYQQVDGFIYVPLHINQVNHYLLEGEILDIDNQVEREKFFVGVLENHPEYIYSFSYGTKSGEYYGARRNENHIIEIMRNNKTTGGHSWYYSVSDSKEAEELVVNAGKFDPRTREWYKVAERTQRPAFSPIYKHFVMDDLTVSVATPVYDKNGELHGVLGTHIVLSQIDNYLRDIVKDDNAMAVIVEKDTGNLIANSLYIENFKNLKDGSVKRTNIEEIDYQVIVKAYMNHIGEQNKEDRLKADDIWYYIKTIDFKREGLEWVIITAIPQSYLIAGIMNNLKQVALVTIISVILASIIYLAITNRYLKPINQLIETTECFSRGELRKRADVFRYDEIGRIAVSFNKMANSLNALIDTFEEKVKDRTQELEITNGRLKESKDQLKLVLDSTAEAIYGIDDKGHCTFCNVSCIKMLGYDSQDELIGKNMHDQIHHSHRDGSKMAVEECKIFQVLRTGKGVQVEDEVFWKADGTSFDVSYYSYPQFKDGKIVGAVVTFMDITDRKKAQDHIKYMSIHDSLTGLYNRVFFEDKLKKIDTKGNMPLSIIFGDVNGLKLTNDIFGHAAGDELLKRTANILRNVCRTEDVVARVGGDEFAILLPNTKKIDAKKIVLRIKGELSGEQVAAIGCSMSLGCDTKTSDNQNIERIMESAENEMYKEKTLNRESINSHLIGTIIDTLHNKSLRQKRHSQAVGNICHEIAREMKLPQAELRKIREAGFLHDIGKITLDEALINRKGDLSDNEKKEMQQHPITGYRILNLFDETIDLAEAVLSHHEKWNGTGYPKGLEGKEIPKSARIIAVAEYYDRLMDNSSGKPSNAEALSKIKEKSGIWFDPEIVEAFLSVMSKKTNY